MLDEYTNPEVDECKICVGIAPYSISRLLENLSSTIDDYFHRFKFANFVFGACNGLVSLGESLVIGDEYGEYCVRFWNLATRIMFEDSPRLRLYSNNYKTRPSFVNFGFGFDNWSDTYKVVVVLWDIKSHTREVKVYCLGDTCWRKILTCPNFPVLGHSHGQFTSGTVNWLTHGKFSFDYQWRIDTIDQLVIFSYDLKEETYKYLLMSEGLIEVPPFEVYLGVLNGFLCLYHEQGGTHFVVWLMKEFGVEKSWT